MNTDRFFAIGSTHETCEDYAISGTLDNEILYAIVCDGCSSADDVDFGARMLALSARELLRIKPDQVSYEQFARLVARRADIASAVFPLLDPDFLDATLLIAWVEKGILTMFMFGDGLFLHKSGDLINCVHVNYEVEIDGAIRPAPDYISYYLDGRREVYGALKGEKIVYCGPPGEGGITYREKLFTPVMVRTPVRPGDFILLTSDGIDSFRTPDDTNLTWQSLVPELIGFKTHGGVFVQRRVQAMLHKLQKDLVRHADDFSVAAIHV